MGSRDKLEPVDIVFLSKLLLAIWGKSCRHAAAAKFSTQRLRQQVEPYSTSDDELSNQFVHLVNNSIGKNSSNFANAVVEEVTGKEMHGYMLTSADFSEYLKATTGEDLFQNRIQPQMQNIARWASMCAVDAVEHRKNSWELYGYDFMIDETHWVGRTMCTLF